MPSERPYVKDWYIENNKIYGKVFNHHRLVDGALLNGSDIRKQGQEPTGVGYVQTRNTRYLLFAQYERGK